MILEDYPWKQTNKQTNKQIKNERTEPCIDMGHVFSIYCILFVGGIDLVVHWHMKYSLSLWCYWVCLCQGQSQEQSHLLRYENDNKICNIHSAMFTQIQTSSVDAFMKSNRNVYSMYGAYICLCLCVCVCVCDFPSDWW